MWVGANTRESKLNHVGAPNKARPGCSQSPHGHRVMQRGGLVLQHHRSGFVDLTLHVKKILDGDGQTTGR
jgi:hypothetical protein